MGETVDLSYDGPDAALAKVTEEIRTQGFAQIGDIKLHKFIVEREMPAIGTKSHDELVTAVDRSSRALRQPWPRATWLESYVCENKMYCIFLADSVATLHEHALLTGMPLDSAKLVRRVIDPGISAEPV